MPAQQVHQKVVHILIMKKLYLVSEITCPDIIHLKFYAKVAPIYNTRGTIYENMRDNLRKTIIFTNYIFLRIQLQIPAICLDIREATIHGYFFPVG